MRGGELHLGEQCNLTFWPQNQSKLILQHRHLSLTTEARFVKPNVE